MSKHEKTTVRPRGRPPANSTKTPISFRIHPGLLETLQTIAKERDMPYQTLMHDILSDEVSTIVNLERSPERQKVALMLYQLRRIAERLQLDCPGFALQAQDLEEFIDGLDGDLRIPADIEEPGDERQAS